MKGKKWYKSEFSWRASMTCFRTRLSILLCASQASMLLLLPLISCIQLLRKCLKLDRRVIVVVNTRCCVLLEARLCHSAGRGPRHHLPIYQPLDADARYLSASCRYQICPNASHCPDDESIIFNETEYSNLSLGWIWTQIFKPYQPELKVGLRN